MPRRTPAMTSTPTAAPAPALATPSPPSPSRLKRSIRGVRNLLTFRHFDRWHNEPVALCGARDEGHATTMEHGGQLPAVAVTLTADVCGKAAMDLLTMVPHCSPRFVAHDAPLTLSLGDVKGYVHYEPKRGVVGLGNQHPGNSSKHARSVWLTLEQYAWVVRRLQEEEELVQQHRWIQHRFQHHYRHSTSSSGSTASNTIAPMLGILRQASAKGGSHHHSPPPRPLSSSSPISATRRLSRLVMLHPATQRITHSIHSRSGGGGDPVLLLPKTLLLHAAAYIPMTKPLPPVNVTQDARHQCHHQHSTSSTNSTSTSTSNSRCRPLSPLPPPPFEPIPGDLQRRLERYVQLAAMATHQLSLDNACHELVCRRCRMVMHDEALSYLRTIRQERRQTFDTYPARSSVAHVRPSSAVLSAAAVSNSSSIHTTTAPLGGCSTDYYCQDGYVAVDDERQEIIVTFPGTAGAESNSGNSSSSLYTASFATVPWQEEEGIYSYDDCCAGAGGNNGADEAGIGDRHAWRHGQHQRPWVLEAAAVAWRRCEMTVATALMRLCRITPNHYRVVIIGHALGAAVAALCASSLVMTGLLVDRPVTLCAIGPPRTGSHSFASHLADHIETIRITQPEDDALSHLPPRTSGLIHFGTITVVSSSAPAAGGQALDCKERTWILRSTNLGWIEDQIAQTWPPSILPTPSPRPASASASASAAPSIKSNITATHPYAADSSPYTIWGIHLHAKPCQALPTEHKWLRVG